MNKSELIKVRPATLTDKNFILASFLKGLYYGGVWYSEIPKKVFMERYHLIAEALIASPKVIILVACLVEDPDVILGYSILSEGVVHWVFVKKAWRGIGVGRQLVPNPVIATTHISKVGLSIIKKLKIDFNPFLL